MHSRFFSALAALVLFSAAVYGQQAVRNPKKEQVILKKLAAVAPGAVEVGTITALSSSYEFPLALAAIAFALVVFGAGPIALESLRGGVGTGRSRK